MNTKNRVQVSGIVGMVSAVLWLIALFVEYQYDLQPPSDGSLLYLADQILFSIALAGYLTMLLGLWRSRAAGEGTFGKISLGIFIAALASLLIAQIVSMLTNIPGSFLFLAVGGLLQLLGGLLTGIAVVTARRWDGWQRFAPLLQGLLYLILIIPVFVSNQDPTQLGESLWQVTWFITSLALFTKASQATLARRPTNSSIKP
jgi:hypothetical protein